MTAIAGFKVVDTDTQWIIHRSGRRAYIWKVALELVNVAIEANLARRIYRINERTIEKYGVVLPVTEYAIEGRTTTLLSPFETADIITLHRGHATQKQFHSEFKTEMNLERMIGPNTLNEPAVPDRHVGKRRRSKTVMQVMMSKVVRMIKHAERWILGTGESSFAVFNRNFKQLKAEWRSSQPKEIEPPEIHCAYVEQARVTVRKNILKRYNTDQKSLHAGLLGVVIGLDWQVHEILRGYLRNSSH
jgi:hypothetical protein